MNHYAMEELEERRLLAGVTTLSFRSGDQLASPLTGSAYAGQQVYLRADASGMQGQTISVQVWEDDGSFGDDKIGTYSLTIGPNGFGTVPWTTSWRGDDGSLPFNKYYLYFSSPTSPSVYSGPTDTGNFLVRPPQANTWSGDAWDTIGNETPVIVRRIDDTNAPISPTAETWIVIHGRGGSASPTSDNNIYQLATAVKDHSGGAQVLIVDWSVAAKATGWKDFSGEGWIPYVASWISNVLSTYGFTSNNLNLVGHSWGAVMSAQIAADLPGGVNRIVALDPAMDATVMGAAYSLLKNGTDPLGLAFDYLNGAMGSLFYDTGSVSFSTHANASWAFLSSVWGSNISAQTAGDSFIVDLTDTVWIDPTSHSDVVWMFTNMLDAGNSGNVSSLFSLDKMTSSPPWQRNRFAASLSGWTGDWTEGSGNYEGIIRASGTGSHCTVDQLVYRDLTDTHQVLSDHASTATPPTTTPAQTTTLTVSSPNGGEIWNVGSDQTVNWSISGDTSAISAQYVGISIDAGANWTWVSPALDPMARYYSFAPDSSLVNTGALVLVEALDAQNNLVAWDESDNSFAIQNPPNLTVTSPIDGETWHVGTEQVVNWSITGDTTSISSQFVGISTDGGTNWHWITSAPLDPSARSFLLTPDSSMASDHALVFVGAVNADNQWVASGYGDGNVAIQTAPAITIDTPNAGDIWRVGRTQTVTWSISGYTGGIDHQVVGVSVDGGTTYTNVSATSIDASIRSYSFVPDDNMASAEAKIVVEAMDATNQILAWYATDTPFAIQMGVHISGILFNDINANGRRDTGEKVLAGRKVFVDSNNNGVWNVGEPVATSNAKGQYSFANFDPGKVVMRPLPVTGWRFSNTQIQTAGIAAGASLSWDVAVTTRPLVSGVIFNDANGNGRLEPSELRLSKVRVYFDSNNNGVFDAGESSALTDINGVFNISASSAGRYVLRVVMPKGNVATIPRGASYSLQLSAGSIVGSKNFGMKRRL